MKKKNLLASLFIMCYQTYTKYALVLCRLKLLNIQLSEICDSVFDQAILTNFNWCIFSNQKYGRCTSICGSSRNRGLAEKKPPFINP